MKKLFFNISDLQAVTVQYSMLPVRRELFYYERRRKNERRKERER